ncbi:MAG: hypothetical protein RIC80_21305 [Cyclobacteriaceae bacterium]
MGDELKKYVDEKRERFDVYDEDLSGLWEGIDQRLDQESKQQSKSPFRYIWRAAAVLLLVSATALAVLMQSRTGGGEEMMLYRISPELAEAEAFYNDLIAEKLSIIQTSIPDNDFYKADIEMLNEAYDDLKQDLKDNADNQEVVEAMIANYKIRLTMLERILQEIDEGKDEEADQHINL